MLDLLRDSDRRVAVPDRGGQLIDGANRIDRQHPQYRRDDALVHSHIEVGLLSNQGDFRTQPAGFGNGCSGSDAAALGERIGRDHAAMDRIGERDHSDGAVLQAGVGLLFAGRKEAVEIKIQALRLKRFSHELHYGE